MAPLPTFERVWRTDIAAFVLLIFIVRAYLNRRGNAKTTVLNGPSGNALFGIFPTLIQSADPSGLVDKWAKEYGRVFSAPMAFGYKNLWICDVKAAAHILARDTFVYKQTTLTRTFVANLFGKGILWAEDEGHRRQRKALTPAFSNAAIRGYLSVFYDSAYKLRSSWEAMLDSGSTTIEVQKWMNNIALDNLGIAGFGHEFGCLDGKRPEVVDVFEAFESPEKSSYVSRTFFFLSPVIPALMKLPTKTNIMMKGIKNSMKVIGGGLIERSKQELSGGQDKHTEKSIIGLLIKAETASSGLTMSEEEVYAQATLLFAGYETTSISLTWALIELCKNPEVQDQLRKELSEFQGTDPTWEQLTLGLPYLNAVTQETLRTHAPLFNINRSATEDNIIPLGAPITTASGEVVSELVIARGTTVQLPLSQINLSEELWGPDAKEFKPERWIGDNLTPGAKTIQGYHHVMTFADGPRLCLGRNFALATFKSTLAVLIRNFAFELPNGPETPIGRHKGVLPRAKVEGEDGPLVPLKIRRLE